MVRERIETLAQQTAYLLEKQKELLKASGSVFSSLLSIVDERLKSIESGKEQDEQDLKSIRDYISDYKQKSSEQLQDDVDFLQEQLGVINQIKSLEDDAKMQELLNMIIDKVEKLEEMESFKERVEADVKTCKKDLDFMFDDIKSALEEGKVHEFRLMLEAIKDQEKHDHPLPEDSKGCCSSCKECDVESTCQDGVDIFDAFDDKDSEEK